MSGNTDFDSSNTIVYDSNEGVDGGDGSGAPPGGAGGSAAASPKQTALSAAANDATAPPVDTDTATGADVSSPLGGPVASPGGVPSGAELLALEREAEQLSQLEVETLLAFLTDYYTIDLVRLSGGSSKDSKDPQLVAQQQQLVNEILRVEGCAQCLGAQPYEHDAAAQAADADKTPDQRATARVANDAFILLGCKLLHCKHVVHVLCVLKLQAKLRAAAAAGSVTKMILPTLDLTHSTSFFRVIAFPIGTQGSLLPSLPSSHTSPHHPTHSYYLELASTHHMSNAQNLHLSWTHAPVHSFIDMKTGGEYIMLLANHPEAGLASYGDAVRPRDLSVTANGVAHGDPQSGDFASFFLTRGKFHFTCIQQTDKSGGAGAAPHITSHWSHTLNYDLSTTSASTPHMKLVLVDAQSKNILTIGVQKIHPSGGNGNSGAQGAALAIAYVKYEFAPPMQTPPLSPPLSLHNHAPPAASVVSMLAGSMGGGHLGGLDAFTGSTGALTNSAAFAGGMQGGAFLPPNAMPGPRSNMFDPNADTIVRDPRDPPTMRLGTQPMAQAASAAGPDPLAGIPGLEPRDAPRSFGHFDRFDRERSGNEPRGRGERGGRNDRFGNQQGGGSNHNSGLNAASGSGASDFYANETGDWDLVMLDAALDRQLAERRNKPDPFGERAGGGGGQWDRRRGSDDRTGSGSGGGMGGEESSNDALFLPALPSFPQHLMSQPGMQSQPVLNLTLEQVKGNVVRLTKSHGGSRFVQSKLEQRDGAFFALFYEEMKDHVSELMVDNFGHFAIEKLIALCSDEQALTLLQRLAPNINIVACQKHGSFSVQALVDTLHTPAQIYTLVEAMKPDILRIITHASGHFVVLRMLQRFPYQSTKFIDDALILNAATIATDHHGLRVVKAVLAVRRSTELTRLFKQVARLTMKLVENQYGNYCVQAVLDVAPPGVRTNIKVKMEGKYMRLSKQKFSSNVVERCLKQSSSHWRTIIIRELIAQPAVSELLRDRYGNYVLQTALAVANAQQVQEILRSITPYLPSLRDNVRSKWKKMLKKAGSLAAAGQAGAGFTGLGGDSPQPTSPASPSSPASRSDSPFNEPSSLSLGSGSGGGSSGAAQAAGQRVLASVFINPNQHSHAHHHHHNTGHLLHSMHPSQIAHAQQQMQFGPQGGMQGPFGALAGGPGAFGQSGGAGDSFGERGAGVGNFNANWGNSGANFGGSGGAGAGAFNPNSLGQYNSSSYGSNPAGGAGGLASFAGANTGAFGLGGSGNLSSSLAAQLNNPYGVGVAGLNALGGGVGGSAGLVNAAGSNSLAGLNYGFGTGNYAAGVNNAFGALGGGQAGQSGNGGNTLNAGIYDPNNGGGAAGGGNLRMF